MSLKLFIFIPWLEIINVIILYRFAEKDEILFRKRM